MSQLVFFPYNLLTTIICIISFSTISTTHSIPPPPPITCNTTACILTNAYGIWNDRKDCIVPKVIFPTTQEQIQSAVAEASKNNLKIKVVSKFSHTIPKLACPTSKNFGNSVLISTQNYNSNIEIDVDNLVVTVDSGVGLRELIDKVEEKGLSLVAAPYWEGVSIGGLISTGAHGSSWWGKGGAVHDHVVGITLVTPAGESDGYAKIVRLEGKDPLLNAAKVSLGMLGVISKVTISLERGFKRSISYDFREEGNLEVDFMTHGKNHEFGDITWYPSKHTAVYRNDDRVPLDTKGDGVNDFLGFQSNLIAISQSTRSFEKSFENARNVNGKCTMASTFIGYKKLIANGLKNNNLLFTGYPVIGHQGKMQTSGSCLYSKSTSIATSCAWDPRINGLSFYESTAIFPASKFGDFIRDIKKLRDIKPENFCGIDIYNGILIRFIKASGAYLGQTEDSVVIDFNYYRASDGSTPRLNQDVIEELEQIALFKYGAKPHWAKNRNLAFLNVERKYANFDKFMKAKKQLDPKNIFSSEWSDEILFGREGLKGDGCALEGQCICSEDRHCSPDKGYLCQSGLVYEGARVCRFSKSPKI